MFYVSRFIYILLVCVTPAPNESDLFISQKYILCNWLTINTQIMTAVNRAISPCISCTGRSAPASRQNAGLKEAGIH